ncbi:MAG: GIY-YIG nuclease family protein [Xanthobacteraceae bacterium]
MKELSKYSHIFNFMYHLVYFPQFVRMKEDEFYVERHPTQIKLQSDPRLKNIKRAVQRIKSTLEPQYWPPYRDVLTLRLCAANQTPRSLDLMEMRREISGFWKMLPLDKTGTDKHGNPIQGKTWVTKELTWAEGISAAKGPASSICITPEPLGAEVGYIYIMRSPAHERHIYKIGFTNRNPEERASDLSASSGQPDHLIVLQSWKVLDARRVEQAIHRQLGKFRLSGRREFFKVKFERASIVLDSLSESQETQGFDG